MRSVGILGVGSFLPDTVRTNDWWPAETVEIWRRQAAKQRPLDTSSLTPGMRLVLREMESSKNDPFKGAIERRVLADGRLPSDGELIAAKRALENASIDASEIDLLLTSSFVPDVLNVPNAFTLQRRLGIGNRCLTTGIDAGCNALPIQLAFAQQMIAGGQAKKALLVQSSMLSRLLPMEEPFSVFFGDGASAIVVGAVSGENGILGAAHFSDGGNCGALIASVPGKNWYDEGRVFWHHGDKSVTFSMLLSVPDIGREAIDAALANAHLGRSDVDFFACHQGTPWFRKVIQEHAELGHARTLDTFAVSASLVGGNVGLVLDMALGEGLLKDGDVTAIFASGVGSSWSSMILRWGR